MGLPIERLIIATNANDILPRTIATGYEMKGVVATTSPSMDIQVSSNFERYLFEASGRDAARVRAQMQALAADRRFELGPLWDALKADFSASSASEADVADCIRRCYRDHKYLDPHTACGIVRGARQLRPEKRPCSQRRIPPSSPTRLRRDDRIAAGSAHPPVRPYARQPERIARARTNSHAVEDSIERAVHRKSASA